MEKMIEKLGLYDLFVNLLVGFVIYQCTLIWLQAVCLFEVPDYLLSVQESLVCGYIMGIILQELGHWLQINITRKRIIKKVVCELESNSGISITKSVDFSKKNYYEELYLNAKRFLYNKRLSIEEDARKKMLEGKIDIAQYLSKDTHYQKILSLEEDHDLLIATMARSLTIYSTLLTVVTLIARFQVDISENTDIILILCMLAIIVFGIRWRRFTKRRVVRVLQLYTQFLLQGEKS